MNGKKSVAVVGDALWCYGHCGMVGAGQNKQPSPAQHSTAALNKANWLTRHITHSAMLNGLHTGRLPFCTGAWLLPVDQHCRRRPSC